MSSDTIYRIQLRRGLLTDWEAVNPILGDGEPGFVRDTGMIKIGDGVAHWADLPYLSAMGAGAVTPPVDDNDTSIATTAWVMNQGSAVPPPESNTADPGVSTRWARGDHAHELDFVSKAGGDTVGNSMKITAIDPNTSAYLWLEALNDGPAGLVLRNDNVHRWILSKNSSIESGSDSGSDFSIARYNDAGVSQGNSFAILRNTGQVMAYPAKSGGVVAPLNDTGYRQVSPVFGWGASSLLIRRMGNRVIMRVSGLGGGSSTNTKFYAPTAGFVPMPGIQSSLCSANAAGALVRHVITTSGYMDMPTRLTSDPGFSGMIDWFTDDTWPTSLPGTAYP